MIVADASVVVAALVAAGPAGERARARLAGDVIAAPHVLDLEVTSAVRRLAAAGILDDRSARQCLHDLAALRVRRAPHVRLLPRCWELRQNLTVYDAAYIALAELLDVRVVTADRRLAVAPGIRCEVELLAA